MAMVLRSKLGVIDLSGTVALALLHTGLCIAYVVPGLATGVYAPTPGRVSVISRLDAYGPALQIGFGLTAALLLVGVIKVRLLVPAHAIAGSASAIYAAALWFGWALSDPKPTIITSLMATGLVAWHIVLFVTYGAALSLVPRSGGRRRREGTAR